MSGETPAHKATEAAQNTKDKVVETAGDAMAATQKAAKDGSAATGEFVEKAKVNVSEAVKPEEKKEPGIIDKAKGLFK